MNYRYKHNNGKAIGTKGWRASHDGNCSTIYTGLWKGNRVVAVLVDHEDDHESFEDASRRLHKVGDEIVQACNTHDALLEFYRAHNAWISIAGHPDATADDENKAEARYDAALKAAREALTAAGVA